MTLEQMAAEFGFANTQQVYRNIKMHPEAFEQQSRQGRTTLYLVTDENSQYLQRKRHPRGSTRAPKTSQSSDIQPPDSPAIPAPSPSPESPQPDTPAGSVPTNGETYLTFDGMVNFATKQLGSEGLGWVLQMIEQHGDELQKGQNQFDKARLEELLSQRKQPQIS